MTIGRDELFSESSDVGIVIVSNKERETERETERENVCERVINWLVITPYN